MDNWHDKHKETLSAGDRIADLVSAFVGSWLFIIIHGIWFGGWILLRVEPFPYGLLTLIVSLEAIFLSTFVMMSQNRSADRDRVGAEADYKTNQEAERRIEQLQQSIARMESEKMDKIIRMLTRKK